LSGLPEIPGGWSAKEIRVLDRMFRVTLPADPDAFLDDPAVHAAHEIDEYMPYWPYLWPAAYAMSAAVLRENWPPGAAALEIGAGIGLVGLAALSRGLRVTFSDYQATAVELALRNARENGFPNAEGLLLDWRAPLDRKFPIILGCDVVYEIRNHAPILDVLDRMLAEEGVCWIGDGGRQHAHAFCELANRRSFHVELKDETGRPLTEPRFGAFQLIVLRRQMSGI
jgi:predicted nicotinamide N-methyase